MKSMNKYKFINEVIDGKKTHCHTYGGAPLLGTSSVVGVISKPLTFWASGLAVAELGWKNPKFTAEKERMESALESKLKIEEMSVEDYLKLLDKAYKAHSIRLDKSADVGTSMHERLENYCKNCIRTGGGKPYDALLTLGPEVNIFSKWACENVKEFMVSEGYCYSERLWLGGITDCYALLKNGHYAVIDFKSSRECYISQFLQVCLYDIQISENGVFYQEGNRMFEPMKADEYIIFPFGAPKVEPSVKMASEELKKGAEAAVTLYKLTNQ